MNDDKLIQVCDHCLQASCWQGIFFCDNNKEAGTTYKTVAELRALGRENECYWKTDDELANEEISELKKHGFAVE